MRNIDKVLEERGFRYSETDFWDNPIIGKEVVRFDQYNPKYKSHFKTVKGFKHFDDFVMDELKEPAEKHQTLNACGKLAIQYILISEFYA